MFICPYLFIWNCLDNGTLVAKLPLYHHAPPHHLSMHPKKPLAISTSSSEAILWDTELWDRKRLLVGSTSTLQQASFSNDGESIITAFSGGSILVWNTASFTLSWKISLDSTFEFDAVKHFGSPRQVYFATSQNGEFLAYGGEYPFFLILLKSEHRSNSVLVWNMMERRLLHEILIPSFTGQIIQQIQFVGSSPVLPLSFNHLYYLFI